MKTLYQCETCGKQYESEDDCKLCEKKHGKPIHAEAIEYLMGGLVPTKIRINFSNGHSLVYVPEQLSQDSGHRAFQLAGWQLEAMARQQKN